MHFHSKLEQNILWFHSNPSLSTRFNTQLTLQQVNAASKTRTELTFIVPLIRYMLLLQHTTHHSKSAPHRFTKWEKQTVHSGEEVTGQPPSPGSCAVTSIYIFPTGWFLIQKYVSTDPEGCQRVNPAGLPEGGGAADGAPAPAHRAILRRVHRRRAAGHGVWVHEARRPQPLSPVRTPHLLGPQELIPPFYIKAETSTTTSDNLLEPLMIDF